MQYQNYLSLIKNLSPMQDIKYALSKSIYVIQDVKFIVVINEFWFCYATFVFKSWDKMLSRKEIHAWQARICNNLTNETIFTAKICWFGRQHTFALTKKSYIYLIIMILIIYFEFKNNVITYLTRLLA